VVEPPYPAIPDKRNKIRYCLSGDQSPTCSFIQYNIAGIKGGE
jgi:hypothetical protein